MMLRVSSKTSLMAAQISSLLTRTTSSTVCRASSKVICPTSRTATPSAKMPTVVERHPVARPPASWYMASASNGSTPTMRTPGIRALM